VRRSILILVLAALATVPALSAKSRTARPAQQPPVSHPAAAPIIYDATHMGSPAPLDANWRVGISADPAASLPAFDDSAWAIRNAAGSFPEVAEPDTGGKKSDRERGDESLRRLNGPDNQQLYAWFRLHIQLSPNHGPVALLVELPVSHNTAISMGDNGPGIAVFANGRLVHPDGPHGAAPDRYPQISRLYNLQIAPGETSLVLAVRTLYLPFGAGAYTNFFSERKLFLGEPTALSRVLSLWSNSILFERLPRLVVAFLLFFLACFLLALYFGQKGHAEYLWLALHELAQVPIAFIDLSASTAHLDSVWYFASVAQLFLVSAWLYFEFLTSFLSLSRRRWYVRLLRYTAPVMILIGPALLLLGRFHAIGLVLAAASIASSFWMLGWLVFIFFTLLRAALRRNFEAALLLVPLVLSFIGSLDPVYNAAVTSFTGRPSISPLTFEAGPIPIAFSIVADLAGILVIVIIIFLRFLRIQRDQERASSELAAARSVQELMIPQEKASTPGYEVESVYNPANEVGGDFFHVQPTPGGGLIVVVGDVAGKGLTAAMSVSMLIGALRRSTDLSPAAILAGLNRVVAGSQSFTTCLAAYFGPQGELTLSCAGHLPPYLNSQEVALPGGLPLGVLPECSWEEVRLFLHPGDRLLMLSDGVVEARRPSGELFGFDRVHNLSNQSAFYIADAAADFGQEDDITVLTVRRLDSDNA
jgi:sigma-B regulation protein RsbU (phosphoserine phosphatase)